MKRFKNILMICDEQSLDEEVVSRAVWLAKENGAAVTLADVIEAAPGEMAQLFGRLPGTRGHDLEHEVLVSMQRRLSAVGERFRAEGIETREEVIQGIPFIEVIKRVLTHGHDLVMKAAAGETEGRSVFFASMDMHLLRKCPCPVWIMKKSDRPRYSRVLAAVDPDPGDRQRHALNRLVLDLATSLSAADHSHLHIVNAWQLDAEDSLKHTAFARVPKETVEQLIEEERQECEARLQTLLGAYPNLRAEDEVHMLHGRASTAIPEFAEAEGVELIVMGTVGRTGVRGFIIGNTAEAILNQVKCAVLAVKPPGFETPVR